MGRNRRRMVEVLCRARMACGRICLDRFRLSRRADALRMAVDQFAVRHRRYVRFPKGQFLLLQSLVGIGAGAASVPALELGATRRRADFSVGPFEPGFGRAFPERQEPGIAESAAAYASGVEGEVRAGRAGSTWYERWQGRAHPKARNHG